VFVDRLGDELACAAWAFAHGMVELELDGRLALNADLEAAWQLGVAAFAAAGEKSKPRERPRARARPQTGAVTRDRGVLSRRSERAPR
jgi:Tetracyclin repressor-like, C-terminal domain